MRSQWCWLHALARSQNMLSAALEINPVHVCVCMCDVSGGMRPVLQAWQAAARPRGSKIQPAQTCVVMCWAVMQVSVGDTALCVGCAVCLNVMLRS